jgi:thioredoxin-related protein
MNKAVKLLMAAALLTLSVVTYAQTELKKVYDESINPMEQIDSAIEKARSEGKFVVCQVGGNWCPWCLKFADFMTKDEEILGLVDDNFVYIHVNYNPRKSSGESKLKEAEAMMQRLGNPGRFGFPVFVVLNSEGNVVHIQDSALLEEGKGYSKEKVVRFFSNWTPKAMNGK